MRTFTSVTSALRRGRRKTRCDCSRADTPRPPRGERAFAFAQRRKTNTAAPVRASRAPARRWLGMCAGASTLEEIDRMKMRHARGLAAKGKRRNGGLLRSPTGWAHPIHSHDLRWWREPRLCSVGLERLGAGACPRPRCTRRRGARDALSGARAAARPTSFRAVRAGQGSTCRTCSRTGTTPARRST